ncbi:8-oxo-dGTP pyrophosphatase MutT (NUDIX family) [Paraburkholderia sp. JPY419]
MSPRIVSCGVVLLDPDGRVLLAHATETTHWDIPKGQGEDGEAPHVTALREMVEETGIALEAGRLKDLGLFVYRRDKDLHLVRGARECRRTRSEHVHLHVAISAPLGRHADPGDGRLPLGVDRRGPALCEP